MYVTAASAAKDSLGQVLGDAIGSPLGIALQLGMLAGLVLLLRLHWGALLARRRPNGGPKGRGFESRQSLPFRAQQIADEPRRQKHSTSANPARRKAAQFFVQRQVAVLSENLDDALAWAAKTSAAIGKPIEIRPFWEMPGA